MKFRESRRQLFKKGFLGGTVLLADNASAQTAATPPNAPEQLLQNMIGGSRLTQLVYVAAKLRIADHLKDGSKSLAELATATKTHDDSLYRLLRTLASMGIFVEEDGRRFRLNPAGDLLQSGVPGSLRVTAEVAGEDWMWKPWGALLHSVQTGQTAFDHLYGKGTFDWFGENPAAARLFDEFQSETTLRTTVAVVEAADVKGARQIVDVGGGAGLLLTEILRNNPESRGVLFDLAHVITAAKKKLDPNLARRTELVPGDFFKSIPSGGDIYIMKAILHDWDDARAIKILESCRKAMAGKGKLMVIEELVCQPNEACRAKLGDVMMLVRTGGRNRTEAEYKDLLSKGGFTLTKIVPTRPGMQIMEATPKA